MHVSVCVNITNTIVCAILYEFAGLFAKKIQMKKIDWETQTHVWKSIISTAITSYVTLRGSVSMLIADK